MSARTKLFTLLAAVSSISLVGATCDKMDAMKERSPFGKKAAKADGDTAKSDQPKAKVFVSLDGHEARPVKDSPIWKIQQPVSTSPTLRYRLEDKASFGRINSVIGNVFVQFGDGFSDQAEYIIMSKEMNAPDKQLKPDTNYDLGNPSADLSIRGRDGQEIKSLTLKPGTKYRMNWTIAGDKSETALLEFKTK